MADPEDKTPDPSTNSEDESEEFDKSFDEFLSDSAPTHVAQDDKDAGQVAAKEPQPEPVRPIEDPPVAPQEPDLASADGADDPDDIWATATPEQKAAFDDAEKRWKSDKGRAGADAAKIAELQRQLTEAPKTATPPADPSKVFDNQDWKDTVAEIPGLSVISDLVTSLHAENAQLKHQMSSVDDRFKSQQADDQFDIYAREHPDWESVTGDDLAAWAATKPTFVQQMVHRNAASIVDGLEAAHVLSLYKTDNNISPPVPEPPVGETQEPAAKTNGSEPTKRNRDSQRRLEANLNVPAAGGTGTPAGVPDGFDDAFDHYAAKGTAVAN